jgi:long-chain-fatty-acid--CoA ligase ACSBG
LKQTTVEYFASLDMILLNFYGLSETTGTAVMMTKNRMSLTTTGYVTEGTETKIYNPDENGVGEICMRGRLIMNGYLNNEAATKEVIDSHGFFHSGDLGKFDDKGFLNITGRIKELIITAGGENISPVNVEDAIKIECPVLSNVMVIGENRKFLAAIMTLKVDVDLAS